MMFLEASWFWLFLILIYMYYKRATKSSKIIYMYLAMSMVIVALAHPVFDKQIVEVQIKGSDVIVALDISHSMQAEDIQPNRLNAAKSLLKDLVERDVNDRFGVIAFTTNAIILSPLTKESELLLNLVNRIDETMVMTKGTSLLPALKLARKMSKSQRPKLLLFTDGGDADSYAREATFAKENNLQVSVVMLATLFGSPLKYDDDTFVKDSSGNIVVTSQNSAIKQLSDATDGAYLNTPDASEIINLLKMQYREDFKGKSDIVQYREFFYFFIFLALLFFMLAYTTLREKLHVKVMALLVMVGVSSHAGVLDFYYLFQAQEDYNRGAFEAASRNFSKVEGKEAAFNAAVASYKRGKYEDALTRFKVIQSGDVGFKATLYYNMALCCIRLKEFDKARENLIKSLTLKYDNDAYENLQHIKDATHYEMITRRQQGEKRADDVSTESSKKSKKTKEGGGSNMNVAAESSNSASDAQMKTRSDAMLSFSKSGTKLSSSQYELINQRSVSETSPW